jgi:hypothetical protein
VKSIATGITIRGTPGRVWAVLTDFRKYPEWNPFIREASGDVATGARLTVRIHPPGGRPMTFRPIVQQASPERELRWLGHLGLPGLFDGEHVFRLEPSGTGETHFTQSERFRGILVPIMPNRLFENTRRGFDEMNHALRAIVESGR